jgi:hypothetical protein
MSLALHAQRRYDRDEILGKRALLKRWRTSPGGAPELYAL